jgi:hypothetical protein
MEGMERFEELARRLAARTKQLSQGEDSRPTLTLVTLPSRNSPGMDHVLRESHCRMIKHFRRAWGQPMQLLIDQACFGYMGIEQLPDDDLIQLHKDLERAMDCMREGVSFEDAGLLRARYG